MPIQFTLIMRDSKYLIVSSTQIMGTYKIVSLNSSLWGKRAVSRIVKALNTRKLETTIEPIKLGEIVGDEMNNELTRQCDSHNAKIDAFTVSEKNN